MAKKVDIHNYDDIINMPRHVSKIHPHMNNENRAAQFAPFAALTGHKEAVNESERITEKRMILDENENEILDQKIQYIIENIHEQPFIKVTYFVKDLTKNGGSYVTIENSVKKINEYENSIIFIDGLIIKMQDIYNIEID